MASVPPVTSSPSTGPTQPRLPDIAHRARSVLEARPWLTPLLLVLVASVALLHDLGNPDRIIFDETYYVNDARSFLETGGVEDSFAVHPPVGKWLIAASIQLIGDDPTGWRFAGALAGVGMVLLTWLIGRRLFRNRWQPLVGATLLLVDGLFLVQARTSMLDIFLAFFVLLGAWLLVRDLQALDDVGPGSASLAGRGLRDRWLAGVAFGLAIGTKWSGLLALATALVLVIGFEVLAHRRTGRRGIGFARLAWVVVGPLVLLPVATYLVTYGPWLAAYEYTTEGEDDCPGATEDDVACDVSLAGRIRGLWREHEDIARFHRDLESTHTYRAEPYTWPVLGRPVAYYYETCKADRDIAEDGPCEIPEGTAAEILAVGNPGLWWTFAALIPLMTAAMGRRDPSAWVVGGFYSGQFLPWLLVARPAFLFYMVPAIPFMALGVALALGRLRGSPANGVPWLAGLGAGLLGALVARLTGAGAIAIAITFAVAWVVAPLLVAGVRERVEIVRDRRATGSDEATIELRPVGGAWWPRPAHPPHGSSRTTSTLVTTAVLLVAIVLFFYFLPAWTGHPIDPDALRTRWWFSSWI